MFDTISSYLSLECGISKTHITLFLITGFKHLITMCATNVHTAILFMNISKVNFDQVNQENRPQTELGYRVTSWYTAAHHITAFPYLTIKQSYVQTIYRHTSTIGEIINKGI